MRFQSFGSAAKVLSTSALAAVLLTSIVHPAAAAAAIKVTVDNVAVAFPDAKPYTESSRVLIPVRFVSKALGGTVDYKNKTVYITQDGKKISMKVNGTKVTVGGKTVTLDVPARVKQNRTYVPLRFVSEALGASVDWNQAKRLVSITTEDGETVEVPTVPDQEFDWKPGYTDLAEALFKQNMKVSQGRLTFTLPEDATADYYNYATGKREKLTPGQSYTYSLGKGQGFISVNLIYPGKDDLEGYSIFLDGESKGGTADDAVVSGYNGERAVNGSLSEVIKLAQSL